MSFEDLPEPEVGEHEHEYVQRCTKTMKLKTPDIPESQLQAMCTTKFRTTEGSLGRVTLKISGTAKERADGFMDLDGELHGLEEFTRKVVKQEIDDASVADQVILRIEALEDRIKDQETKINALTNRLEQLGKLKEVKELLERGTGLPIKRLRDAIPENRKSGYGIKKKLSIAETKKPKQVGIVASPQPAEDKITVGNKRRLRDFVQ